MPSALALLRSLLMSPDPSLLHGTRQGCHVAAVAVQGQCNTCARKHCCLHKLARLLGTIRLVVSAALQQVCKDITCSAGYTFMQVAVLWD